MLYDVPDHPPYVVVRHDRTRGLFIAPEGWDEGSTVVGPIDANGILRAFRVANVRVPDGCELGPWTWGVVLLGERHRMGSPNGWTLVDPAWLPPSVTPYPGDIDARIDWHRAPEGLSREELATIVSAPIDAVGVLARGWCIHPRGSPVVRTRSSFVVVDVPATDHSSIL